MNTALTRRPPTISRFATLIAGGASAPSPFAQPKPKPRPLKERMGREKPPEVGSKRADCDFAHLAVLPEAPEPAAPQPQTVAASAILAAGRRAAAPIPPRKPKADSLAGRIVAAARKARKMQGAA